MAFGWSDRLRKFAVIVAGLSMFGFLRGGAVGLYGRRGRLRDGRGWSRSKGGGFPATT